MGQVTFNEDTLGYVTIFQNVTLCTVMDCVDTGDKIIFVVGKGEASKAIGRKGETVARVRLLLKRDIQVIEFSEKPEEFVANVFHAYDVKKVEIEDRDGVTHATVTVAALRTHGGFCGGHLRPEAFTFIVLLAGAASTGQMRVTYPACSRSA